MLPSVGAPSAAQELQVMKPHFWQRRATLRTESRVDSVMALSEVRTTKDRPHF